MKKKTGVVPPSGFEWELGKTAASISFVKDAELYLLNCQIKEEKELLTTIINQVKEGILVFSEWTKPEEYLVLISQKV